MTAINIFVQPDRAVILTDALGYDLDGEVCGVFGKCVPLTHLGAAVVTRGGAVWVGLLASSLGMECDSFDDLVEEGGAIAERTYEACRELNSSGEDVVQIAVAGWSTSRQRMECYFMDSIAKAGREPWTFYRGEMITTAPEPSLAALRAFGLDGKAAEEIDPDADGVALLNAQRAMKFGTTYGGENIEVHIVGGHALMTEVRPDAVTQRIIHRWRQDRIGELVRPDIVVEAEDLATLLDAAGEADDELDVEPARPMSRQERRAAERMARKRRH